MNITSIIHETKVKHVRRAKSFLSQTIRGLPESYTGSTPNLSPLAPICSHSEPSTSEGRHTPKGRLKGRDDRATHGRFLDIVVGSARRTASLLRTGRRGSEDCKCGKRTIGALFFTLPIELQLEVVKLLGFHDIINLRRTSRKFRSLIKNNESHIAKHHIKAWVPKYITILYPPPVQPPPTLKFLEDIAHRQSVSNYLALALAGQIVKEMMKSRRNALSPGALSYVIDQLRYGMAPLILALFHFLETYQMRKTARIERRKADPTQPEDTSSLETQNLHLQSEILEQYPDCLLLQVHQMYHLLLHLFFRRLTPPVVSLKRTLRRGNTSRPANEAFAQVLLVGGINKVWNIYKLKGYGRRRKAFDKYVKKTETENKIELEEGFDELGKIWVPAAEKRLLGRGIVHALDEVSCCGEFVAQLLENGDDDDEEEDGEDSEDEEGYGHPAAGMFTGVHFPFYHRRLADDGIWDRDLIGGEEEELDEDDFEDEDEDEDEEDIPAPASSTAPAVGMGSSHFQLVT